LEGENSQFLAVVGNPVWLDTAVSGGRYRGLETTRLAVRLGSRSLLRWRCAASLAAELGLCATPEPPTPLPGAALPWRFAWLWANRHMSGCSPEASA
jgi:hypothetical protein